MKKREKWMFISNGYWSLLMKKYFQLFYQSGYKKKPWSFTKPFISHIYMSYLLTPYQRISNSIKNILDGVKNIHREGYRYVRSLILCIADRIENNCLKWVLRFYFSVWEKENKIWGFLKRRWYIYIYSSFHNCDVSHR